MRHRNNSGAAIAESAASLALLLPLAILLIFVVAEVSYAYLIKSSLSQAARQAARDLSVAYGKNPAISTNRSLQDSTVFEHIRLHNLVNSNQQFSDPVWQTGTSPHTVEVKVSYSGGQYGLPTFPHPDPLNIAGKIHIIGESTYRLE
jgi:hypothetical protein